VCATVVVAESPPFCVHRAWMMGIITPFADAASSDLCQQGLSSAGDYWRLGMIFGAIFVERFSLLGVPWTEYSGRGSGSQKCSKVLIQEGFCWRRNSESLHLERRAWCASVSRAAAPASADLPVRPCGIGENFARIVSSSFSLVALRAASSACQAVSDRMCPTSEE